MDSYEGQAGGERAAGGAAGDAGEDISSEAKESGPGLLELSKPSEFRLRALKQQKYLTFNKGRARHGIRCSVGFWAESRRGRERDGSRSLPAIVRYEECWRAAAPALYWFRAAGTGVTGSDCECGLSFFSGSGSPCFLVQIFCLPLFCVYRWLPSQRPQLPFFLALLLLLQEPFSHINYSASDKKFLFLIGFHATINGGATTIAVVVVVAVLSSGHFSICLAGSIYGTSWRASFILALASYCRLADGEWRMANAT